jgi:RHH-type rel operon transcriptional repressor/antitoxin RelB
MLVVRLSKELEHRLQTLANQTGKSKSYYARKAIERYFRDRERYLLKKLVDKRHIMRHH